MAHGIAVSIAGKGVDSSDPRDFVVNSSYDTFIKAAEGTGTISSISSGGTGSVTIAHGLSFVPLVMFWCELKPSSGKWFFGATQLPTGDADAGDVQVDTFLVGSGPYDYGATYVDATNFRLQLYNSGGSSKSVKYFYAFFANTAAS